MIGVCGYYNKWIPSCKITRVRQFLNLKEYNEYKRKKELGPFYDIEAHVECKCKDGNCITNQSVVCIHARFPIYMIYVNKKRYLVVFSEYEKLERILEGTDNPMYEFVHELRYNPNSFMKGRELQEAEKDFEVNKKHKN